MATRSLGRILKDWVSHRLGLMLIRNSGTIKRNSGELLRRRLTLTHDCQGVSPRQLWLERAQSVRKQSVTDLRH
jgi:hypothetical protein